MAANVYQKIVIVDIDASTEAWLIARLADGYHITHIVNLNPTYNKLLIVYCEPYV